MINQFTQAHINDMTKDYLDSVPLVYQSNTMMLYAFADKTFPTQILDSLALVLTGIHATYVKPQHVALALRLHKELSSKTRNRINIILNYFCEMYWIPDMRGLMHGSISLDSKANEQFAHSHIAEMFLRIVEMMASAQKIPVVNSRIEAIYAIWSIARHPQLAAYDTDALDYAKTTNNAAGESYSQQYAVAYEFESYARGASVVDYDLLGFLSDLECVCQNIEHLE